ncbi:hypothetical protein U2W12_11305 [Methylomicrobium sp. Wu6]|nr:hypothetical protein [Methylomicrobium sp. Wu6]
MTLSTHGQLIRIAINDAEAKGLAYVEFKIIAKAMETLLAIVLAESAIGSLQQLPPGKASDAVAKIKNYLATKKGARAALLRAASAYAYKEPKKIPAIIGVLTAFDISAQEAGIAQSDDSNSESQISSATKGEQDYPSDKPCPPCETVTGRFVIIGTIGYRPLDIISDNEMQHGVFGSHHNIFIAKQAPRGTPQPCRCFWAKQKYVLKPWELTGDMVPVEEFVYKP